MLTAPVLIAAFDGWIDAAGAATACANHVAEGGRVVASFDVDSLNDYRARRPVLDVVDGVLARMQWPDIVLRYVEIGGRDLLVLVGPEPDYKWKQLGDDVLELAHRLGVVEWISLGAIPAAVPHTRPVPVLATASTDASLRDGEQRARRHPAGAGRRALGPGDDRRGRGDPGDRLLRAGAALHRGLGVRARLAGAAPAS